MQMGAHSPSGAWGDYSHVCMCLSSSEVVFLYACFYVFMDMFLRVCLLSFFSA